MLAGSPAVSLVQQYLRGQQGVIEVAKPAPDQLLVTVGERVQATVTGQLPSGRFAVLIKDQLLDLNLPRNTQPGETLELVVAAKEPKLTFLLPPPATAESKAPPTGVALSQAGQLLGELAAQTGGKAAQPAQVQQTQPLFIGAPQPDKLAAHLATRLAESGLFYESHQAEWVNGQRPLQTLLREPQAQWHAAAGAEQQSVAAFPGRSTPLAASLLGTLAQLPEPVEGGAQALPSTTWTQVPAGMTTEQGVRHLVQQQMQLLENQPLIWQGLAWPEQPLNWQLQLENERDPAQPEAASRQVWQTRLEMNLPHLGQVGVLATLRDGAFSLRFEVDEQSTAVLLRDQQALLNQRFAAAGLVLSHTQVLRHDDPALS